MTLFRGILFMGDVAIIKKPNLILDYLISILEKQVNQSIDFYEPEDCKKIYVHKSLPKMIFIDIDKDRFEELYELVTFCLQRDVIVVVWTTSSLGCHRLAKLFKLGLNGYFCPEMEKDEITFAIRRIINRKNYIHPYLSSVLLQEYLRVTNVEKQRPTKLLTRREWEVLELIAQGKTTKHISEQLYISTKTVTNHTASILRKLRVKDRTNAALLAIKNRWVIL